MNIVRGILAALAVLLFIEPLSTAVSLTFDVEPSNAIHIGSIFLAVLGLALGGWWAGRTAPAGSAKSSMTGLEVWSGVAMVAVLLAGTGFDFTGWGLLPGDSDEVLMPFNRTAAWLRVLEISTSLAAAMIGAWAGAHIHGHEVANHWRRWRRSHHFKISKGVHS